MAETLGHTAHGDAPLASAKKPDPTAYGADLPAQPGDAVVARVVSINRPRAELYRLWRNLENLPRFMENVIAVRIENEHRSHWFVAAPAGTTVEWDSEITEDVPDWCIAWRSIGDAAVRNSGRVEFEDSSSGRGTEVTVTLAYDPPAGAVGQAVAKLWKREPRVQARRELRRFKQLTETGEVSTARMTGGDDDARAAENRGH
jgi:uncharacterized membrane protein